jgi:hypothetical protein
VRAMSDRGSSFVTPFLTSALNEDERVTSRPGRINPVEEPHYPLNGMLGWSQSDPDVLEKGKIS